MTTEPPVSTNGIHPTIAESAGARLRGEVVASWSPHQYAAQLGRRR